MVALARAVADEQSALGAFAISAMRSRITGHVFLRRDNIIASNARFHQLYRECGWLSGRRKPFTLIDAVRTQSKKLVEAGDAASVQRYARDGGDGLVEVRTERIGDVASQLVAATLFDVSEVANAARAAEAARAEAKLDALREVNRQKDEFLGVLSHELRNPLAPIRNSVHILSRVDGHSEQGRRAREVLERQVAHLARLVDDLLDVTRIERGKLHLQRSDVDVVELLRQTAEDHGTVFKERGIALELDIPTRPVYVAGDRVRLAQVIGNLLHNASKFTGGGGRVTLAAQQVETSVEIGVRDTGVGIDPTLLPHVFEPFTQAGQALAREAGGLGLGLALVKGTVELHGGTVRAESAGPGRGAEFIIHLPAGAEPGARAPQHHAPPPQVAHTTRPLRVLVVEDNPDAASSLADLLSTTGHEVEAVPDGPSALTRARETSPDVVLCDIGLPGMTGYEVARELRRSGRPVRLIAVTGYAQPDDVRRALEAGFEAHVAKPADLAEIERLMS